MNHPLPEDLAPLLEYLGEIGFDELYLPAGGVGRAAGARREPSRPTAAEVRPPLDLRGGDRRSADRRAGQVDVGALPAPPPGGGSAPVAPARGEVDRESFGPPPADLARFTVLGELGDLVQGCTSCRLSQGRTKVVFGSGDPHAELMFIGEGPGAEEDRQGLPFVGPAGELLSKIIAAIGLAREECYITNVVKCRPPGNRDPLPDETARCRGYLERQIDLVRPKVIVALGRVAAQTLLATDQPLGRLRGRWHSVRGVPTRATYHPAALLRNASWKRPTWEDMQVVRDRLSES